MNAAALINAINTWLAGLFSTLLLAATVYFALAVSPQWACNHIEVTTTQCDIAMGAR